MDTKMRASQSLRLYSIPFILMKILLIKIMFWLEVFLMICNLQGHLGTKTRTKQEFNVHLIGKVMC